MAASAPLGASAAATARKAGSEGSKSSAKKSGKSSAGGAAGGKAVKKSRTCKTCPRFLYECGAKLIDGAPITVYHLFIRVTDQKIGAQPVFRAGPTKDGAPSISGVVGGYLASDSSKSAEEGHTENPSDASDFGTLHAVTQGDYLASIEFSASNKFVEVKETRKNHLPKFAMANGIVNAKKIKYVPTGPNSNSYAMSILKYAGLPRKKPNVKAPGHGMYIL